jgi:hypothetical protein
MGKRKILTPFPNRNGVFLFIGQIFLFQSGLYFEIYLVAAALSLRLALRSRALGFTVI